MVSNVTEDFDINQKKYSIRYKEEGYSHALVVLLWRFKGKFRETLELEQFPFDVQVCDEQFSYFLLPKNLFASLRIF